MTDEEKFEDYDEESEEWSPEWYDLDFEALFQEDEVVVASYAGQRALPDHDAYRSRRNKGKGPQSK